MRQRTFSLKVFGRIRFGKTPNSLLCRRTILVKLVMGSGRTCSTPPTVVLLIFRAILLSNSLDVIVPRPYKAGGSANAFELRIRSLMLNRPLENSANLVDGEEVKAPNAVERSALNG